MARFTTAAAASGVALLLALTACSGGSGDNASDGGDAKKASEITIYGCTPQNPLVASNTTETCGGNVLDAVTSKLMHYKAENAEPELDIAESIESEDNQTFTVKLKKGYKFSDGTEVLAHNFVDAWNWAAYGPNGQSSSYFLEPIEGFAELQCPDDECKEKPKADKMSGLAKVDDHTFTIKTTEKVSNLKVRLGYTAFAPQPDSFLKDPESADFGKMPVGAGAFVITENTPTQIILEKNKDYSGDWGAQVDKVVYRIYKDTKAAYADLTAGNLDFMTGIPADKLIGDLWKTEIGADRTSSRESGVIQTITFSSKDKKLTPEIRKAISMATDRQTISDQIFNGTRIPATGWVSPVVDGAKKGQCGDACTLNEDKAKEMWKKAGGYDGKLQLWVNGDGGHKEWAEAFCNQINNVLEGAQCVVEVTADFKTLRNKVKARELMGMFRTGWQMDYPSIENFLTPMYAKGASSNDSDYDNPKFDELVTKAAAAKDPAEANTLYQEAEALLAADFPTMPMFYGTTQAGWSKRVTDVKVTAFGTLDLSAIKLK